MGTVDEHVGFRLLQLRLIHDLTTAQLAAILCTSDEDVEQIENGHRRLRAVEMMVLCSKLNVPISHFFEGLDFGLAATDLLGEFLVERSKTRTC